jgi:hypothetical protein
MAEKRSAPRSRRRLLVDFETPAAKTTGFTQDLSRTGLFVRTIRIPRIGTSLRAVLHLPAGGHIPIEGTVVRSYRAPAALRSVVPTGFGLRIERGRSPEYDEISRTA